MEYSATPNLFPSPLSDMKERIIARIRPDLERIEAEINRQLTTDVPHITVVSRHIMGSGGKRLRPLLMVLSSRMCGYQGDRDATLSIVFEFIHAASLLHDDVVDHAETRRNHPAANTIWGNSAVVLVGDYLYSKAILLAVGYNDIRILDVLSRATTTMSEGEVLQLAHADDMEIDEKEYLEVITRKTAVLISAACRIGVLFAGGSPAQESALSDYGHNLGLAFQLIDDTLDYTGDTRELGKPVGNDIKEGKATLPLICALRNAKPADRTFLRKAFSTQAMEPAQFEAVKDLVHRTGGIEYTYQLAVQHVRNAKDALRIFPESETRELLCDLADFVICRRT